MFCHGKETNQPMVEDFLYVCDDAYTREQLIAAECEMLHILEYNLNIPIAYRFLRRFARVSINNGCIIEMFLNWFPLFRLPKLIWRYTLWLGTSVS